MCRCQNLYSIVGNKADNGATTRLIMNTAERFKLPGIALLLDQEKAYDRVHPQYLQACLERFGFPSSLITSILSLFFGTSLCINVNGFLTASIQQASGLRQGDPLSPLFFNLDVASNTQQMSKYLDSIITKIERHANILSQRGLSILGRSMIANSLLLSRIWHSIRILCPPQSFFQRIRSVIIKFLRYKNFPSVKFQDCRRPRNEGGIAILDPAMQHSALQLRWLIPMLQSTHPTSTQESFAKSLMRYYLCVLTFSPSVILPLLFSEKRSPDIKKIGCFQSMFRTLDHIDYEIN
ncbi:hypothetical protein G6F61_012134 [Rhizopus arrhizus]|nr:hypothetical protein G6F61_012134 [Rhizopus arrhizus]